MSWPIGEMITAICVQLHIPAKYDIKLQHKYRNSSSMLISHVSERLTEVEAITEGVFELVLEDVPLLGAGAILSDLLLEYQLIHELR